MKHMNIMGCTVTVTGLHEKELAKLLHAAVTELMADGRENTELRKDAERYKWLSAYFVSDDTEHDDAIVSASSLGIDALHAAIDAAMQKEQS